MNCRALIIRFSAVGLCLALAGCGVPEPLDAAELCARLASATEEVGAATMDDEWEILARVLPGGFAGVTSDALYLKQPDYVETVRESTRRLGSCPNRRIETLWLYLIQNNSPRKAKYDWVELRRWYKPLLAVGGWTGADINEGTNRLLFRFTTQAAVDAFRLKARALGVPGDALSFEIAAAPVP